MRLKTLHLVGFKGFTDLTITDIPETAKLVMLIGPNGTGKSSVFDALLTWSGAKGNVGYSWEPDYHVKFIDQDCSNIEWSQAVRQIEPHGDEPINAAAWKKAVYFRSAHRNEKDFKKANLNNVPKPGERQRTTTFQDDPAVTLNYRRLVLQTIEDVWGEHSTDTNAHEQTLEQYAEHVRGRVNQALGAIIPHLRLESLGDPVKDDGSFYFSKGTATRYPFKALSGGEKAVFDIVIDMIANVPYYDQSIVCIDEPETHVNPSVHGSLLDVIYNLTPPKSQLWIASHAIGMLRKARDLEAQNPGSVAFLNFEADFDQQVTLKPTLMDRPTWQRALGVALDDMAALIAPNKIIVCEGGSRQTLNDDGIDAEIYNRIFGSRYPDTVFVSAGSNSSTASVQQLLATLANKLFPGATVTRLIDRDDRSDEEVREQRDNGTKVLSQRNLESYLYSDEILTRLAEMSGNPNAAASLISFRDNTARQKGTRPGDFKSIAGQVYAEAKKQLQLINAGNNQRTFMRETLAPLIEPSTSVHQNLETDIFS